MLTQRNARLIALFATVVFVLAICQSLQPQETKNLYPIKQLKTSLIGYINQAGELVVDPDRYKVSPSETGQFSEGLAPVKQGEKWGLINWRW